MNDFRTILIKKKAFVLIGSRTIVAMKEHRSHEEMIAKTEMSMYFVLHSHPDFSSGIMDDGNITIRMIENVFGFMQGKNIAMSKVDKEVPMEIALAVRTECLKAAKQAECIAIIEPT